MKLPEVSRLHSRSPTKPQEAKDDVFTFSPKVSTKSAKIVESLGMDFMSRQQRHLEKQKQNVRGQVFKTFAQLFDKKAEIPVNHLVRARGP